jgi:hypothetical protein
VSDGVLLLFLRQIFPEWSITRDGGCWRAGGRVVISAPSADELMDVLVAVVPDAGQRVRYFFGG